MSTMKLLLAAFGLSACLAVAVEGQTPPAKIGVIDLQSVIIKSKDGEKDAALLKAKFAPRQAEFEKRQVDLNALQTQLRNGQNTMSDENKQKLMREIDQRTNLLKRDNEDFNADLEQEQQRMMGELVPKILSVLKKYATEHGFAVVLDISNQQTPIIFASNTVEITLAITDAYDKSSGLAAPTVPKPVTPPLPSKPVVK
jgi:outer membrane protein